MGRRSWDPSGNNPEQYRGTVNLIYARAENGEIVGYTPAEYGVSKGDGGGDVKPINSARGLLFLAIVSTIPFGGLVYGVVRIAIDSTWHILGETWGYLLIALVVFPTMWFYYFTERRAEKLRKMRNLPRPIE